MQMKVMLGKGGAEVVVCAGAIDTPKVYQIALSTPLDLYWRSSESATCGANLSDVFIAAARAWAIDTGVPCSCETPPPRRTLHQPDA